MRKIFSVLVLVSLCVACSPQTVRDGADAAEVARWHKQADNVTIIRDNWGIPHIYGKTDADAVFGMLYAQAEDDFNRVEMNYVNAMGRLAEIEGESELYRDLRMRLFIDPEEMKTLYNESPDWLQELMDAFADGLNYYLYTHPEVQPKLILRFEPWMALTFSEGSIGGDIERVSLRELRKFYGNEAAVEMAATSSQPFEEPTGSNGFSIAPSNSATGNALFLINPHTSFFFRAELHVVSEEGLNTYGATTWGQFFIYQGFNENAGWMHTSSRADAIDWYLETITKKSDGIYYKYGNEERPLETTTLSLAYKDGDTVAEKQFTVYHSHHGPIIREQDGKWVSIHLMERPADAITQSFLRTKANNLEEFRKTMDIRTNSSNNTVYADSSGNIAYYHGDFIPRRDPKFDWNQPLDGSNPETDWHGLHTVDEMITVINPPNGWIQNTNNWPFSAAGDQSPRREDYPSYMAPDGENPRGLNAVRLLAARSDFTLDTLIEAAYDPYLIAFETLIPSLVAAYDGLASDDSLKVELREQVELLRGWDYRSSEASTATSLAIYWAQELSRRVGPDGRTDRNGRFSYLADKTDPGLRLEALATASQKLADDFGDWQTPWGEINRYQRINGQIVQPFNDDLPSIPVGFASSRWGSIASFGARTYPGTKRMYGTGGNSFVAVVEFGERLRAKAITAGGQSGDPNSPHFDDQALGYCKGKLRDVLFYREDVEKHIERQYHPGER